MHDLKASSNQKGSFKQAFDLFRCRIGGDVEILGFQSQQEVAYRSTYNESVISGILQYTNNPYRIVGDQTRIDTVLGSV